MTGQIADIETADLSQFDSSSPGWDKQVDDIADFDSEQDDDNDLGNSASAAHDGEYGMRCYFNDNTVAYGTMNVGVNQKSGVFTFWFDPNTVGLDVDDTIQLVYAIDGGGLPSFGLRLYNIGGIYKLRGFYYTDVPAYTALADVTISDTYHKVTIFWKAATGVGANDGFMYMFVDKDLGASATGIDNDTQDWDAVRVGMVWTNSAGFSGSFTFDTVKAGTIGSAMADKLAAINGTYGIAFPIMDTTARVVRFTDPDGEKRVSIECRIDPNSLTIPDGENFIFLLAQGGSHGGTTRDFYARIRYTIADGYDVQSVRYNDAGAGILIGDPVLITDAPHHVRVDWVSSSAPGANDGYCHFYVDDILENSNAGLDNDLRDVDTISFGAVIGLDAGTLGIFYMDDCSWVRDSISSDIPLGTLTITGLAPLVGHETLHIRTASGATLLDSIEDGDGMAFFSSGDEWYSLPLLATKARGSFYGEHIVWSQAGCVENTTYNISDDTIEAGYTSGITADGSGKLTVNKAGLFLINWNLVYECDAVGKHIEAGIVINTSSTHSNKGCQHIETKFAGQEETLSGTALLHLHLNDYIQLGIRTTDDGTPAISVQDISLTMVEV